MDFIVRSMHWCSCGGQCRKYCGHDLHNVGQPSDAEAVGAGSTIMADPSLPHEPSLELLPMLSELPALRVLRCLNGLRACMIAFSTSSRVTPATRPVSCDTNRVA